MGGGWLSGRSCAVWREVRGGAWTISEVILKTYLGEFMSGRGSRVLSIAGTEVNAAGGGVSQGYG